MEMIAIFPNRITRNVDIPLIYISFTAIYRMYIH